jgi:hypothetical protein
MNGGHERSDSVLSVNTRTMLGAFGDSVEAGPSSRSPQDEEDEFDALVRSGETMKVSLTPSRLKTFEVSVSSFVRPDSIIRQQPVIAPLKTALDEPA